MRRRVALGAAALVIAGASTVGWVLTAHAAGPPLDLGPVIARVDGDPIHRYEARQRLDSLASVHSGTAATTTQRRAAWRAQVFQSLVDDVVVRRQARRLGVVITRDAVAQGIAKVKRLFPSDAKFRAWLKTQHLTTAELRRRVTLQVLWSDVEVKITAPVKLTDAEIHQYYDQHRSDFTADGRLAPLFEARPTIQDALLPKKRSTRFAAWLAERRAEAKVVVVDAGWDR